MGIGKRTVSTKKAMKGALNVSCCFYYLLLNEYTLIFIPFFVQAGNMTTGRINVLGNRN